MSKLEQVIRYQFKNRQLLDEALTHPSLAYETQRHQQDNQRLEFLGDAVIQLVITRHLYDQFSSHKEGKLTQLRAQLVSGEALAECARQINLGSHLEMGKGEIASGGRERNSALADAFEAMIGAIYLDGGLDAAADFILRSSNPAVANLYDKPEDSNPKGALQEILQSLSTESPVYHIVAESGPDHSKVFEAVVEWNSLELGLGQGQSKKEAEMEAAKSALEKRLWEKDVNHAVNNV